MSALRASVSGPTVLFGVGATSAAAGLWILAPWIALVVCGVLAMALAVVEAMPLRRA